MFIQCEKSASLRCLAGVLAQASFERTRLQGSVDDADLAGWFRATRASLNLTETCPALTSQNLSLERTPLRGAAQFERYGSKMLRGVMMVFVCAMAPLSASAFDVACPEKIFTTQKLAGRENGWAGFVEPGPSHAYVSGISIYDGHPNDMVQLKPDDEMAKEQSWSFLKAPPNATPLYALCHYHLTRVGFIRSLPKGIRKCTVKKTGLLRCEVYEP